jgi:hypothetical protein
MRSSIDRIKWIFFGIFIVAVGVMWFYQSRYVWPRQACEAHGSWWDDEDRVCAVPMPIWAFTHRMPGQIAPETPQPKVATAAPAPAKAAPPAKPTKSR